MEKHVLLPVFWDGMIVGESLSIGEIFIFYIFKNITILSNIAKYEYITFIYIFN